MNAFHAPRYGFSSQDSVKTTTKNSAKSVVGNSIRLRYLAAVGTLSGTTRPGAGTLDRGTTRTPNRRMWRPWGSGSAARLANLHGSGTGTARLPRDRPPPQRRGARDPRRGPRPRLRPGPAGDRRLVRARRVPSRRREVARGPRAPRDAPRGLRLRRRERGLLRARVPRARVRRQRDALVRERPRLAVDVPDPPVRQRRAEGALVAADGPRRGDRLLRPDRARLRFRPRPDADDREAGRRRLGDLGQQDVDHERGDRRSRGRVGRDGRRDPRVPRSDGDAGLLDEGRRAEALAPGVRHLRADPRRGPRRRR